jgi:xylulokinase
MALVAGIDSSTQSCTVVVYDADDGTLLRSGRAAHPAGTEVDPAAWEQALDGAVADAGGLADVGAISVCAQQHGYVSLDDAGAVVRPALLWNDNRSAPQAAALIDELGGPAAWADAVGSVPVASFTVTKARWVAENEPEHAARTAAVCLPHDWISWRLRGAPGLDALRTDRGDASGTGWYDARNDAYQSDLVRLALGSEPMLPTVLGPSDPAGEATMLAPGALVAAGTGDNMAAALGLHAEEGDVILSLGTSGVASAVAPTQSADASGTIAGFADATGRFLPLVCTLNAARVFDAAARLLGVGHAAFSDLALSAPAGSDGLVLVPYLEGERTPALPDATGSLHGVTLRTMTPAHLARACVEGVLCGLAEGLDALRHSGLAIERVILVGGGASSEAVRRIAPEVFGTEVLVPAATEAVANGAARQAAWALDPTSGPPGWAAPDAQRFAAEPRPEVREHYADVRDAAMSQQAVRRSGRVHA